jgi:hypothetical protein
MTALLQKAMEAIGKLSPDDQDAIASLILEELADEERWQEAFARSPDTLARLAEQAREEIRAGRVRNVGMDVL